MAKDSGAQAVTCEAGGKVYELRFKMAAMAFYERQTGKNAFLAADSMAQGLEGQEPVISEVGTLFWAALVPRPDSLDEAFDIMDEIGMIEAIGLLGKALEVAFPEAIPLGGAPAPH